MNRLTHERCGGIKTGYWSPEKKEDLVNALAAYENTGLTPEDDEELVAYLWPIVWEMIKTAVENRQNLIVEGCYIPQDWRKDFSDRYLREIRFYCLVMSRTYIEQHFSDIRKYAGEIEERLDDTDFTMETAIEDNVRYLEMCEKQGLRYILIDGEYKVEIEEKEIRPGD